MKLQEASFKLLQFVLGQELQRGLGTFLCPPLSTNIRQRFRWICIFHHLPTFTLNDMIPVSMLCKPYLPKNWERLKCYKTTFLGLAKSQRLCVSWVNKCNIKRFCGSVLYSYTAIPALTPAQQKLNAQSSAGALVSKAASSAKSTKPLLSDSISESWTLALLLELAMLIWCYLFKVATKYLYTTNSTSGSQYSCKIYIFEHLIIFVSTFDLCKSPFGPDTFLFLQNRFDECPSGREFGSVSCPSFDFSLFS